MDSESDHIFFTKNKHAAVDRIQSFAFTMNDTAVTDENISKELLKTGADHPVNAVHREWVKLKDRSVESVASTTMRSFGLFSITWNTSLYAEMCTPTNLQHAPVSLIW